MAYIPKTFDEMMKIIFDIASSTSFQKEYLRWTKGGPICNKIVKFSNVFDFPEEEISMGIERYGISKYPNFTVTGTCGKNEITINFTSGNSTMECVWENCSYYQFMYDMTKNSIDGMKNRPTFTVKN